jgi:hypothetical protein
MTCSNGQLDVVFTITTDQYPSDLSYQLTTAEGNQYASGGFSIANNSETLSWCLEQDECYTFNIKDSYGDGMLSGAGYSLYVNGANIMTYTANDKYGKTASFGDGCTDPTPAPSPTYIGSTLFPTAWEPSTPSSSSSINYAYIAMLAVPMALWGGMSYWKMRQSRISSPSNNNQPFYTENINPTYSNNYSPNYINNDVDDINNNYNSQGIFSLETITPMEVPESTYSTSLSPSYPTISSQQNNHEKGTKEKSGFKSMFDEMKESL